MNDINRIVIVGGGLAAATAVGELRESGYDGAICLIAAEHHAPYERPPLSKDFLLGKAGPDDSIVHDEAWYREHDVDLRIDTTATGIDLAARQVAVGDEHVPYDRLLLATGARARHLPMADESGAPISYLRTIDDAVALKEHLSEHVLIVGAGWIGLEVASAVRQAGGRATVLEAAPLPLAKVLGEHIAPAFIGLHRDNGVDLRLGTSITSIGHNGEQATVTTADGDTFHPDHIVVGIGTVPEVQLAEAAGLDVDNGVLVDATLRTSDPHVFAAGDVANHDHPSLGRIRIEHWDAAIQHGRHAAHAMLGDLTPYAGQPYFFTDQFDLGMEYIGHADAGEVDDVIVRGDLAARTFNVLWVRDGLVVAGMHANDWDATDRLREWVGQECTAELRDASAPLPVRGE